MISALAILCVRNEAIHIHRCIDDLISSGLEVYLIDNGSTDGTREAAETYLGKGLIGIHDLPWRGAFSLTDQLVAKRGIISEAEHDWILHCDADEWLMSPNDGQSLLEGFDAADNAGFNCVNFHEIVFLPLPGEDFEQEDYAEKMQSYYFFQPSYPRLYRAWRRDAGLDNSAYGGHLLIGEGLNPYPIDFILRHYIVLSMAHAQRKYYGRIFSTEDRSKGWHGNRISITKDNLVVKPAPELRRLDDPNSREFDLSAPAGRHFWEW
ncbi:glycosyltransferase [Methylobacterium sp. E-041]|uniref:glycosyltransferase n=1 Tax=Methylobacterium sp. E-041 TaxID=2836573 RepID=UPI001FBC03D9|nr:glycosyltransferase [Methylobacterium sp. E-041]MCJ2107834.1 glycosyltransferase [Methylobacterium sp. E-041]